MTAAEARKLVGNDFDLPDAELVALVETLQPLARLIVEGLREERRRQRQQQQDGGGNAA